MLKIKISRSILDHQFDTPDGVPIEPWPIAASDEKDSYVQVNKLTWGWEINYNEGAFYILTTYGQDGYVYLHAVAMSCDGDTDSYETRRPSSEEADAILDAFNHFFSKWTAYPTSVEIID